MAEAWRNLVAVGARPLALTDNLNFGNPEKPEAMGQLVGCIEGIGEAARALDFPIVSGNVSLYNETMGAGILPTPAIGGVGLVADVARTASLAFKAAGEDILLIGGAPGWLGRSAWLATIAGREDGAPPPVDLAAERRNGEFVAALIAEAGSAPCTTSPTAASPSRWPKWRSPAGSARRSTARGPEHAFFFGEDQGRYVADRRARRGRRRSSPRRATAGVPVARIGVTGGDALTLGARRRSRSPSCARRTNLGCRTTWQPGGDRMIPFVIVKTLAGFAYVRPERVVAVSATDPAECTILMTDGVTIAAKEPAEDVVARLEAKRAKRTSGRSIRSTIIMAMSRHRDRNDDPRGLARRARRGEGPRGRRRPLRRERRHARLQGQEQGASSTRWSTPRSRARWAAICTRWR